VVRLQQFAVAALVAGLLAAPLAAWSSPIGGGELPSITVRVDTEQQTIALPTNAQGTGFSMPETTLNFSGGSVTLTDVSGFFDPVLNLAAAATDSGAPSLFSISLTSPLNPALFGVNPYIMDFAGTFTDGGTASAGEVGRITLPAFQSFKIMDVSLNGTDIDGIGDPQIFNGNPPALHPYGPYAGAGNFDCGAGPGCTSFGLAIGFGGSGSNDTYALNGRFEIPTQTPEPGALLLLAGGLLAVSTWRRGSR
jgi:hypothetical protein